MAFDSSSFDQVVFSGGGTRCFWHGGFLSQVGGIDDFMPARICAVSGGALSAASWISGNETRCRDVMGKVIEENERNLDLDSDNATPHQELYRASVAGTLPQEAIDKVAEGPAFQVLLGCPPDPMPPRLVAALSGLAYKGDQLVNGSPFLSWSETLGLDSMLVDARQAAREGKLIDLVCAAATIPPVFDIPKWNRRSIVDGGMVNKAPLPDPDEGRTLFLLTSRYRNLPQSDRQLFIQPSAPVEADKIDFTDRDKLEETWKQGENDARRFLTEQR